MRIKYLFSWLVWMLLAGLAAGGLVFSVSAQGDGPRIIQISPVGQGRAHALAYSPDGQTLAVGSSLGIHLFNTSDLQPIYFTPTDTWVRALAFSPDGKLLASGSYDPIVRLWRASDGMLLKELSGHTAWVRALAFSPNGELLATASDDNTVRLWNIPTADLIYTFNQGTEGVRALAFSTDGTILATGGFDKIIRLWRVSDGKLLRELKGHKDWVRALAFSPDGEWLASGGFDATVRLWRVADGELLVTRQEHTSSVLGLAFSPDGEILASASVDTTVRLWKMPTLEPYDLLRGHTDFIFSIAFSPDGKSLASGAVDNTVRVWDVPMEANPAVQEQISSPSNCKTCHHPRGLQGPPRVIEPSCSVCHADGARALNWCPAFERSPGETTMSVQMQPKEISGFYRQTLTSTVIIHSPGNGEVVYGRSAVSFPLNVSGRVYHLGGPSDTKLTLEIYSEDGLLSTVESSPLPNGTFSFILEGNHGSTNPFIMWHSTFAVESPCLACHTDHYDGYLPNKGMVRLKVTITTAAGIQASDERVIFVDPGGVAEIPVQVLLDTGQSIPDLPIRAETRLYEWRGRTFTVISDSKGQACLQVEALSQNPTTYQISVPPTVVNGVLYKSKDSVQVSLPPGATTAPAVTLHVQAASGEISGHVTGLDSPVLVWAISIPDGAARKATTSPQGTFTFSDLPVSQVLLVADPQAMAAQGMALNAESIDLSQSISAEVDLIPHPLEGAYLTGKITDETGATLPFAWASLDTQFGQTDPASGAFALFGYPSDKATVIISAPGYYSQAHYLNLLNATESPMSFSLVRRPETRFIPWGNGATVIPPETVARVEGQSITFEQGWLWGNGESEQPLVIQLGEMLIAIPGGQFALERLPSQSGWLYIIDGQASIQRAGTDKSIPVKAGDMVYLDQDQASHPVPYDPVVVGALRLNGEVPIQPAWQPSLGAQIRDRLARFGIGTAQTVTFITYLIEVLALLAMLLLVVHWVIKKNRKDKKRD